MADNETTISEYGLAAPPVFRVTEEGGNTVIRDYATNTPRWVLNGKIGGDTVETMTTAERTAITPEAGQLIYDTTLGLLFVGDGSTVGGTAVGGGGGGSGLLPGYRLTDDATTRNFSPIQPIVNVTGNSATLQPDTAYKMYATTGALNVTANPPAANYWGLEGHAEIFVGLVGYVVFDTSKIVLANQLEPDSVNNCTLRFHDGMCYVSVEDHIAGYIVVSATGTAEGSLPYGLTSATQEYIAFDASLNGATVDLSGATASGEKHIVGNGYTETTLTGTVDCGTSRFTGTNLALSNVGITGGTMTLGNVYIPSGSTVAVSGDGRMAAENVRGGDQESVINLGNVTRIIVNASTPLVRIASCTITSGYAEGSSGDGGAVVVNHATSVFLEDVHITGNTANRYGGGMVVNGDATITGCTITNNTAGRSATTNDIRIGVGTLNANDSVLGRCGVENGSVNFGGTMRVGQITPRVQDATCVVHFSSGAILDLTGNTNATTINPGGGITFESGGATVKVGDSTASSSYMMDNVTLPAGAKLTNTAVVDLGGTRINITQKAAADGCVFQNGSASYGGAFQVSGGILDLSNCIVSGNIGASSVNGKAFYITSGGTATVTNCLITENGTDEENDIVVRTQTGLLNISGGTVRNVYMRETAATTIAGNAKIGAITNDNTACKLMISSGASINLTSSINPGGTGGITVLTGGCTVNGNAIAGGTYTRIDSTGTPT